MSKKFVSGIDLGTTNSVLAYAPLDGDSADVQLLSMPMVVDASTIENHNSLPSFLYLATEQEASGQSLEVPWSDDQRYAVGPYARRRAARGGEHRFSARHDFGAGRNNRALWSRLHGFAPRELGSIDALSSVGKPRGATGHSATLHYRDLHRAWLLIARERIAG